MSRSILIIGLFLFAACSASRQQLPGRYVSSKITYWDYPYLAMHGIHSWVVGSELVLNIDHSFTYTTCGAIRTGKWNERQDSLFLVVETNKYKNDSLNVYGYNGVFPKIPIAPLTYKIKKDALTSILHRSDGGKILDRMVKRTRFNIS